MKLIINLLALSLIASTGCSHNKCIEILSPDGIIKMVVCPEKKKKGEKLPAISLEVRDKAVILPSFVQISTNLNLPIADFDIIKSEKETVDREWINNFGERKEVRDNYNQVKIFFDNNGTKINLICRAYNEGIAFAYEFPEQEEIDSITITDENITFRFPSDHYAWSAARAQAQYSHLSLSKIENGCERPLVIEIDSSLINQMHLNSI